MLKKLLSWLKYHKRRGAECFDETDTRNFGSDAVVKITREDLPTETFRVYEPTLINQLDSDFCVGASRNYGAQATEKDDERAYSFAYAFAMAKKIQGSWQGWGTSILAMCKAATQYGICVASLWNYRYGQRDFYANWNNIPQKAHDNALKHKGGTYFEVIIPYGWDKFDAIRAYLWKLRDKKVVVHTGKDGHAWTILGYDAVKDKLIRVDSYGTQTLDNGFGYVSRQEAQGLFTPYIILDMERSLAELLVEYNGKAIKIKDNPDCYLVKDGKKRLLANEAIAWANNTLLFDPDFVYEVLKEDFDKIPTGEPMRFQDGKNFAIVQRVLEKVGRLDLIVEI